MFADKSEIDFKFKPKAGGKSEADKPAEGSDEEEATESPADEKSEGYSRAELGAMIKEAIETGSDEAIYEAVRKAMETDPSK